MPCQSLCRCWCKTIFRRGPLCVRLSVSVSVSVCTCMCARKPYHGTNTATQEQCRRHHQQCKPQTGMTQPEICVKTSQLDSQTSINSVTPRGRPAYICLAPEPNSVESGPNPAVQPPSPSAPTPASRIGYLGGTHSACQRTRVRFRDCRPSGWRVTEAITQTQGRGRVAATIPCHPTPSPR